MQGVVEEKNRNDEYNGNGDLPPGQRKGGGERRTVQGCQIQDLNQVDLPDPVAVEIECLRQRIVMLESILRKTGYDIQVAEENQYGEYGEEENDENL